MGEQVRTRIVTVSAHRDITDGMVAAYLAKYATNPPRSPATSRPGCPTTRSPCTPTPTAHTERLIEACWTLGRPRDWRRLRRWAHMFGFGGHFLTKSRRYSITFTVLRGHRIAYQRAVTAGPPEPGRLLDPETTLVVNFLQFVGAGWHTTADAMLANTSAAVAREHQQAARQPPDH